MRPTDSSGGPFKETGFGPIGKGQAVDDAAGGAPKRVSMVRPAGNEIEVTVVL
jgi:hypothetical protein